MEENETKTPMDKTTTTTTAPMTKTATTATTDKPVLTVYCIDKDRRQYSYSPFVTKLHFRLRYAGISYDSVFGTRNDAPKGKIPFVKFKESGEKMGDSTLIINRLVGMGRMEDLNGGLGAEERARDWCVRAAVEERVYWVLVSCAGV
jgi:hypothetical protein